MSGRFAGLKQLQQDTEPQATPVAPQAPVVRKAAIREAESSGTGVGGAAAGETPAQPAATLPAVPSPTAARPWETGSAPTEPVKALNGRVPRSVRLAFDRQLTDAMSTLGMDVTVDLAVEALARLIIEHDDARERWLHTLWTLKRKS